MGRHPSAARRPRPGQIARAAGGQARARAAAAWLVGCGSEPAALGPGQASATAALG